MSNNDHKSFLNAAMDMTRKMNPTAKALRNAMVAVSMGFLSVLAPLHSSLAANSTHGADRATASVGKLINDVSQISTAAIDKPTAAAQHQSLKLANAGWGTVSDSKPVTTASVGPSTPGRKVPANSGLQLKT